VFEQPVEFLGGQGRRASCGATSPARVPVVPTNRNDSVAAAIVTPSSTRCSPRTRTSESIGRCEILIEQRVRR
jgi:hypothetical protein